MSLSNEQKFLRLNKRARLNSTKIYTTREIRPVELHLVLSSLFFSIHELTDLLAKGVEDDESDVQLAGHAAANGG